MEHQQLRRGDQGLDGQGRVAYGFQCQAVGLNKVMLSQAGDQDVDV
jgi:hypothetical protein